MDFRAHVEKYSRRLAEIEAALTDPNVFDNPTGPGAWQGDRSAEGLSRSRLRLRKDSRGFGGRIARYCQDQSLDSELISMAQEEIKRLEDEEKRLIFDFQRGLLPPDPSDSRNTIIEIRAGAGGSESALFSADLYRMLTRYAEAHGWKVETLDTSPSDLGGFREIIFSVTGTDVYKRLNIESGVHRVQRVPATEAQGRIHTEHLHRRRLA